MKATVFIATSADGFIAREDGSVDWLPASDDTDQDYGFGEFMRSVDAMVMGRNTYEVVRSFEAWPYGKTPVFVLTSRPIDLGVDLPDTVKTMSATPREAVQKLESRGYEHLYVDGGKTIHGFLRDGLLNRLIITRIPVLLGSGIPLFGAVPRDVKLRLIDVRAFDNGLVQSEYKVVKE